MISSLVSLHDSCKRGIKLQKEIVGLHSPLHTIHYISNTSFKTSQPDYGWRSKTKIPKQHKATGQDRILVETTNDRRNVISKRPLSSPSSRWRTWTSSCIKLGWTCIWCCSICEPRGLSNPITMGIKTSKALWVGRGKVVRLQQRLSIIWWLAYEYKNKMSIYANSRKLVVIAKDPELPTCQT